MTELTTSSTPVDPAPASSTPADNVVEPQKLKTPGRGLSIFAILMSLLALGATGFTWYQTQVSRVAQQSDLVVGVTQIGGEVTRLGDSISRLQSAQSSVVSQEQLTTRILESTSGFNQQFNAIAQQHQGLTDAVEKINDGLRKGVNDLVVDEVSQLLKLANNSAIFNADAVSAVKALKLADSQLKELADPRFSQVRRKINEELVLLDSIEVVDVESVAVRINALSERIVELPLENEPPTQGRVDLVDSEPVQEEVNWRTELRQIWRDMVNSIQVQRVDQPPKPLLAPQQRYFLNQNIQLMLSKAELAMLQSKPTIYAHSLDDAEQWLKQYFDLKDSNVQEALAELTELEALSISRELPAVVGSYDLLQSIKGGL